MSIIFLLISLAAMFYSGYIFGSIYGTVNKINEADAYEGREWRQAVRDALEERWMVTVKNWNDPRQAVEDLLKGK
jgi:hypothetical protein